MNKKGIIVTIIIGILCLGIGVGTSYVFIEHTNKSEKTVCDIPKEEPTEESKCNVIVEETEVIKEQHTKDYEQMLEKINDISYLEYTNKNFNTEELSNLEIIKFVLNFIDEKYDSEFSLNRVNELAEKYFGKKVDGEDVPCIECDNVMLFIYDKDKQVFKLNEEHGSHGVSGIYYPYVLNRITSIENDSNMYTVTVKKAFCVNKGETGYCTDYFKSYEDAINRNDVLFEINDTENLMEAIDYYYPEVEFNKISNDKLNTYTYIFEKESNDNFVLKSYSLK